MPTDELSSQHTNREIGHEFPQHCVEGHLQNISDNLRQSISCFLQILDASYLPLLFLLFSIH